MCIYVTVEFGTLQSPESYMNVFMICGVADAEQNCLELERMRNHKSEIPSTSGRLMYPRGNVAGSWRKYKK